MIFSAVLFVAVSSCGKDHVPQERPMEDGTVRVAIEPEFDGLEVDVKSLEIGETDILCYAYYGSTLLSGFPKKQSEVKDGIYFYDIPQNSAYLVFFTVCPEDVSLSYHYDTRYINDYYLSGWYHIIVHEKSEVTCLKKEYYISNSGNWWSRSLDLYLDQDYNMGTVTLSNTQRDCKLMFNFTGMPEGQTAETYIDKIHVKVGGMSLDKVLTMEDLSSETVGEETLWCKTIYTVMGYDLFGEIFRTMDIIIETTDGKIYVVDQFKYNYVRNEQQRININFAK